MENQIRYLKGEALKFHRLYKEYEQKENKRLADINKQKAFEYLKRAKTLENIENLQKKKDRNIQRATQDAEFREKLLRNVDLVTQKNRTRRREKEGHRNITLSRRSEDKSPLRSPIVIEESPMFNPRNTLGESSSLQDFSEFIAQDIEESERIARDQERDLEERKAELLRLAELTGINIDEYLNECPIRPIAIPTEPAPSQPSKLKLWLKKFWQSINCSGYQGGKKTRKYNLYRKYKNKSRKNKSKKKKYK